MDLMRKYIAFLLLLTSHILTEVESALENVCSNETKLNYLYSGHEFVCRNGGCTRKDVLCRRYEKPTATLTPSSASCVLPTYPKHGRYSIVSPSNTATVGQTFSAVLLNVTCDSGYSFSGSSFVYCIDGKWAGPLPQCNNFCKLENIPGLIYKCGVDERNPVGQCNEHLQNHASVDMACQRPDFYPRETIRRTRCVDGKLENILHCDECGRLMSRIEFGASDWIPWFAVVYKKQQPSPRIACGATLVSSSAVVSAARCFWTKENKFDNGDYAVAVGKVYKSWNDNRDVNAQRSDVWDKKFPNGFSSTDFYYQNDIVLLKVSPRFNQNSYVTPICLNFDQSQNNAQLQNGNKAMIASWGGAKNVASDKLAINEFPYVDNTQCLKDYSGDSRDFEVSPRLCNSAAKDKICYNVLIGSGLVFPEVPGSTKYYLRGVLSVFDDRCNSPLGFTYIIKHGAFIRENLE